MSELFMNGDYEEKINQLKEKADIIKRIEPWPETIIYKNLEETEIRQCDMPIDNLERFVILTNGYRSKCNLLIRNPDNIIVLGGMKFVDQLYNFLRDNFGYASSVFQPKRRQVRMKINTTTRELVSYDMIGKIIHSEFYRDATNYAVYKGLDQRQITTSILPVEKLKIKKDLKNLIEQI